MITIRRRIKKWLYGQCLGLKGAFPYYGTKVYFPNNSLIFNMACDQGTYEHEIVTLLLKIVKPSSYFFDVGANIGLISAPILYHNADCRVVSFEPSPNTLPFLMRTVEESKYRDRWQVIGKAVSDREGEIKFSIASNDLGAYDGIQDTGRAGATNKISLPATTVDKEWEQLGRPPVSTIKIDVEGAEILVLMGSQNCIGECRPFVLLEWNVLNFIVYKYQAKDLLTYANESNYRVFSVPQLIPVDDETSLRVQMLKTENFLLVPVAK